MKAEDSGDLRTPGQFAYEGLERVIHEKARLGILTSLVAHRDGLLFNDLKDLCALTDGNLSRHLQILQDAKLVEVWKANTKGRPQTLVRLSESGRARFMHYISVLEDVVAVALSGKTAGDAETTQDVPGRAGLSPS